MKKKIVFFGTPEQSSRILEDFIESDKIEVCAVVTNPDKHIGRKKILTPSPTKLLATKHKIDVHTPEKFNESIVQTLEQYQADFFIIVAYGVLIPQSVIDIPKNGTFNLHFSLLPKYRGASPIQSAFLNGDSLSGISIFKLVKAMDAGDIYIQKECDITQKNHITAWNEMIDMGKDELKNLITNFEDYSPTPQNENNATFCGKFTKEDGEVFPKENTSEEIMKKHRGFILWPGVFYFDENNKRVKLISLKLSSQEVIEIIENNKESDLIKHEKKLYLKTKDGYLEVLEIQKEGKQKTMGENYQI